MQHEEAACVCGMNVSLLGQSLSPASRSAMTREGKPATSVPANHGRHGGHAQGSCGPCRKLSFGYVMSQATIVQSLLPWFMIRK